MLTMDPGGQDYDKADVCIEGSKIVGIGPNIGGSGAVIDCTGKIVMPGFINTHHHQYETFVQRVIPDGLLTGKLAAGKLRLRRPERLDVGPDCFVARTMSYGTLGDHLTIPRTATSRRWWPVSQGLTQALPRSSTHRRARTRPNTLTP